MGERDDGRPAGGDRGQQELTGFKAGFLETVSHALRGPIGVIISYTELLADERDQFSPEAAGFLDVVRRAGEQLDRLLSDLVLLGQIEAGSVRLDLAPVPVGELTAAAARAARPAAERSGITLTWDAGTGPPAPGDRGQLRRMLDYLIGNAIQFTGNGGSVQVTARCDSEWQVEVADSGIGIPAAELAEVFGRFYRASTARAAGLPGAGLGLPVVKALAGLHGGRVEAASTPGDGSRFTLCLPLVSAGQADGAPDPAAGGRAR
jgi:signal transduction histidine kinase